MTKATDNLTPSLSRRDAVNLLAGGVGVGAVGLVGSAAFAGTGDPSFSLIERHRAQLAKCDALGAASSATHAEAFLPDSTFEDVRRRRQTHAPEIARYDACYDAWNAAGDELFQAERALVETEPTTVAGAVAMLRYAAELEQSVGSRKQAEEGEWAINDGVKEFSPQDARINLLLTVASGLSKIAARSAGDAS
jgi:hypothetical protein